MPEDIRTLVYLIRHGETEWNQNTPGYCGWTDIPLNQKGRSQAEALGRRFQAEPLAVVLCSDLVRARTTAETIATYTHADIQTDARFRELNYGAWEGANPEQLEREERDRYLAWKEDPIQVPTPGGETLQQVVERAWLALEEWVEVYQGRVIALVSHKTTVRVLICQVLGIPLAEYTRILQQNAAINLIEFRGRQRMIGLVNDTCHLPGELCSPAV